MTGAYPWIKVLHVVSVIVWMGAQFLLPALLAAHRGQPAGSAAAGALLRVVRRLVVGVMNPAMVAAFVFGVVLAGAMADGAGTLPSWLWAKLAGVFLLSALHGRLVRQYWRAADGRRQWEARHYRLVQGLDLMLLAGVVTMVVARPF